MRSSGERTHVYISIVVVEPSVTVRDHVYTCRLVPCFISFFPQLNCHHGHVTVPVDIGILLLYIYIGAVAQSNPELLPGRALISTCMAWPGCLMHQTWSSSCPLLTPLTQSRQKSPDMPMALSPPATLLFSQTEVMLTTHQLLKQILTSATKCMGRFKTSTKILLIWLPHVNATRRAQQHTACVHETDDRSVALATPSLYIT